VVRRTSSVVRHHNRANVILSQRRATNDQRQGASYTNAGPFLDRRQVLAKTIELSISSILP